MSFIHKCIMYMMFVVLSMLGLSSACTSQNTGGLTPEGGQAPCAGVADGWYCASSTQLATSEGLDPNSLVECGSGNIAQVSYCTGGCVHMPAGVNDECMQVSSDAGSTTCQGNQDGWYCVTNLALNVDPLDAINPDYLVRCEMSRWSDHVVCENGCEEMSSGINDRCVSVSEGGIATCQGNQDGWYCATSADLQMNPSDEFFDTDLVQCLGGAVTQVMSCSDMCVVNAGPSDACSVVADSCGDGMLNGTEECDGTNLNGVSCASRGFTAGNVTCQSCMINTSGCCTHACTGGTQCNGSTQETCQANSTTGCNEWVSTGSCATTCRTTITSNTCYTWTSASGGNELFEICGEMVGDNRMRLRVRKDSSSASPSFGTRPYGARVSSPSDPECGLNTHYFAPVQGATVGGVSSNELTIEFDVLWATGQTAKSYCAYASTQQGDIGYDPGNQQQTIWYYSRKLSVAKICN